MKWLLTSLILLCNFLVSSQHSKNTLLYFSGSDWCVPCMKFSKSIAKSNAFVTFCNNNLNFEQVDFPQKTRGISKNELARRDSLAELYNQKGQFPLLVLLDKDRLNPIVINHIGKDADNIINELRKHISVKEFKRSELFMGSEFQMTLCENDTLLFEDSWRIIDSIENKISSWISTSEINVINENAGKSPVVVSSEVYSLLKLSKNLSRLTQGSFDITVGPAAKLWDWKKGIVPTGDRVDSIRKIIGYEKMELNDSTKSVFLKLPKMRIDLGGIGKGYACEKVIEFWRSKGVVSGVINAGGDLFVLGKNCDNKNWDIAIRNPKFKDQLIYTLNETDIAVATSGDYERYFELDSIRYSHIINPLTCRPESKVTSVTIFSEKAILADALATAVSVLGVEQGLHLINQLEGIEVIIIEEEGTVHFSKGIIGD